MAAGVLVKVRVIYRLQLKRQGQKSNKKLCAGMFSCTQFSYVLVFAVKNFSCLKVLTIGTLTCEHDICLYAVAGITTS